MLCPDPREAVAAMFSGEAKILRSSGFRLGCPVASVALDVASTTETVHKPYADVFASWINAPAEGIAASGTPRETATDLASYILASLEGATILSRTSKSVKPLEQTAQFVLPDGILLEDRAEDRQRRTGNPVCFRRCRDMCINLFNPGP